MVCFDYAIESLKMFSTAYGYSRLCSCILLLHLSPSPGPVCHRAHYALFRSMMCPVRRAPFWPGTVYILWCYDVSGTPSPFRPGTVYICYDVMMCDGDTEI